MRTSRRQLTSLIYLTLVLCLGLWARHRGVAYGQEEQILVMSTFDTGDEGWTTEYDAIGAPKPRWIASGGDPGGYVRAMDSAQTVKWYWNAPPKFLGNKSTAYGRRLTFKMFDTFTRNQTDDIDILLQGNGITLVYDTPYNPTPRWIGYNVNLDEKSGWRRNKLNGPLATKADMQKVLASLTKFRIRGDYVFGADSSGLDSVTIGGPPVAIIRYTFLPLIITGQPPSQALPPASVTEQRSSRSQTNDSTHR